MNSSKLSSKDYQLFLFKSFLWLCLAWGAFALTIVGFFYASIIWATVAIIAIWLIVKAIDHGISFRISRELFITSIAIASLVIFFSFFCQPSVFTGRDQGSFSEAAVRLAQNHKLEFSSPSSNEFFKINGPGRALNFPGFYYNKNGDLVTQFSLVYIAWLALFFAVLGLNGFAVANGILLFTFFVSFYLLLRLFLKTSSALPIMILTTTSFVFMWFSKFTLSENMMLPLVWITILSLVLFLKNQEKLYYIVFIFSALLLCFTRIEGIAFLIASIIVISLNKKARLFVSKKRISRFFLPIFVLLVALIANIYVDFYFYKEIIKAILPTLTLPKAKYLGDIKNNIMPSFYIEKIFYIYGLLGFFIVGAIGIFYNLWKKDFYKLVPFFITLPTFVYFVDDHISADHPWMLRRFMFSLLPVAIFYTGLLLGKWFETRPAPMMLNTKRKLSILAMLLIFLMNFPVFLTYVSYSENKGLLTEVQSLSSKFSANDLILVDQKASGDGWSMLSGPMNYLYGKNAVYFFNTQDLSKIDTSKFSNIYLISPSQQVSFYLNSTIGKKLTKFDDYTISTTRLLDTTQSNNLDGPLLPEKKNIVVSGKIFKVNKD